MDLTFLPTPASPTEIHSRVTCLFAQIHTHISTFYRDVHASITPSMHSDLAHFSPDVDIPCLLRNTSTPTVVLQHVLTAYMLRITDPDGGEIWPRELEPYYHNHNHTDVHLTEVRHLHRRLSVYLYTPCTPASPGFLKAARAFTLPFFPWAHPTAPEAGKEADLVGIIRLALETRIWLYGQEEEYNFIWENVGRRGVVVVPGVRVRSAGCEGREVLEGRVAAI